MLERNVTVTLEKAREWYGSDNVTLREIALQAFNKKELKEFDFTKVTTFKHAVCHYCPVGSEKYYRILEAVEKLNKISNASAAIFKLNIIRKVLNTGYNMHLTKNAKDQNYTWYPYFRFITKDCTYYNSELKSGTLEKIGKITSEGVTYDVLGGSSPNGGCVGLGGFDPSTSVGSAYANIGFLGCATEEIAEHFGKHFGMLIMEAMYGDMVDFKKSE